MRKAVFLMLAISLSSTLAAQTGFKRDLVVEIISPGGLLKKPSYVQDGTAINPDSLHSFLLYDFESTRTNMEKAKGLSTWHVVTAVGGTALFIGGLANFFVAASGVSDLDGEVAMYFTAAGLFLGSAGSWLGNFFIFNKRAELRRESIQAYNASLR